MVNALPLLVKLERRKKDLELTYEDGSIHHVFYTDLRHACPCAKCAPLRNEDETSLQLRAQIEGLPVEIPQVKKVGNYALSFEWQNGCSSGIYRFERLHDLACGRDPDGGRPYVHGAW